MKRRALTTFSECSPYRIHKNHQSWDGNPGSHQANPPNIPETNAI